MVGSLIFYLANRPQEVLSLEVLGGCWVGYISLEEVDRDDNKGILSEGSRIFASKAHYTKPVG